MKIMTVLQTIFHRQNFQEKKLLSGESPILVFVSSVMDGSMALIRRKFVAALNKQDFFVPWAFEFTPPSSQGLEEAYLRKVKESDFLVWLVREKTTEPVVKEIRKALDNNIPILVYRFKTNSTIDENTQNVIKEINDKGKWIELDNIDEVDDAIRLAFGDEIIRALRRKPGLSRLAKLEEMKIKSKARCLARWLSVGVSSLIAEDLFANDQIGAPSSDLLYTISKKRLVVIVGDFGSGKSLLSERLFQKAIENSTNQVDAPIPIYLEGQNEISDLEDLILRNSKEIGDINRNGAFVIIDGIDQSLSNNFLEINYQAEMLSRVWENTTIIITTRPYFEPLHTENIYPMPLLEDNQIISLVNSVSQKNISGRVFYEMPNSVHKSLSRPFFSLLWSKYIENQEPSTVGSPGELINFFVEYIVFASSKKINNSIELLERLAIKSTNAGGIFVPWREIGSVTEINNLLQTRLVAKTGELIGFTLPIFTQWFAANGLVKHKEEITEFVKHPSLIMNWYYSISVILDMFSYNDSIEILEALVEIRPGLIAKLIGDSSKRSSVKGLKNTSVELGQQILSVYESWVEGLGKLSKYVAPIKEDGTIRTIGVHYSDNQISVVWHRKDVNGGPIIAIPEGNIGNYLKTLNWTNVNSSEVTSEPSWIWKYSLQDFSERISKFINGRMFIPIDSYMYQELIWSISLRFLNLGSLSDSPIDINQIMTKLNNKREGGKIPEKLLYLYNFYNKKLNEGEDYFLPIWPPRNKTVSNGNWIWSPYTDDQLASRFENIYLSALNDYQDLVEEIFSKLKIDLFIATLLPSHFHAQIKFSESPIFGRIPEVYYYFEPLDHGENNRITVELVEEYTNKIDLDQLRILTKKKRPEAREWIYSMSHFGALDIFHERPLTNIVYNWLADDLRRIHLFT